MGSRGLQLKIDVLRRVASSHAVILGYHGVADRCDDPFDLLIPPAVFRAQIEMMLAAGFRFTTVLDFVRQIADGAPPAGLAAISFDDAMRNNLTTARPILDELAVPATIYIPSDFLGGRSPWIGPGGDGAILSADEVRTLAGAGWEIGGHTRSHADLSTLSYEECLAEVQGGRETLEEIIGGPVLTFAYPFGRYGPAAVAAVRDAGLIGAVTTGSGRWDTLELTRAMVSPVDPFPVLLLKMTDHYAQVLSFAPVAAARFAKRHIRAMLVSRRAASSVNAGG